ncbi:MAG TPA: thioesterase family protein [Rhodocyclaceae bacterium]|nr:thioesterase family protein [Rhodocyclaceae bacterium]
MSAATERPDDEGRLMQAIHAIFQERIPFNKVLGLEVVSLHHDRPEFRFEMRPDLVGNYARGILHGGVISAVLDTTGGMVAFLCLQQKLKDRPMAERIERFARIGTIDLRVDYLRPGVGKFFVCRGFPLRTGNKVAVARMELVNDSGDLISVGTAAYTVS